MKTIILITLLIIGIGVLGCYDLNEEYVIIPDIDNPTIPMNAASDSLLLHYADFTGYSVEDISGSQNNAELNNSFDILSGSFDNLGTFLKANGAGFLGPRENINLDTISAFTFSIWLKGFATRNELLLQQRLDQFDIRSSILFNRNTLLLGNKRSNFSDLELDLMDGQWRMLTITMEKDAGQFGVKIYVNGDQVHSDNLIESSEFSLLSDARILIANQFDGFLDNIRLYNGSLTELEIKNIYDIERADISPNAQGFTKNMIAQYTFDEQNISDTNGLFGGQSDEVTFSESSVGGIGYSATFTEATSKIEVSNLLDKVSTMTISWWVKAEDADHTYFYHGPSTGAKENSIRIENSFLSIGDLASSFDLVPSRTFQDCQWHMISISIETIAPTSIDDSKASLYIDGDFKQSIVKSNLVFPNFDSSGELVSQIGNSPDGYFIGSIDNLILFNRILSDEEIMEIYTVEKPSLEPLLFYSDFEGGLISNQGQIDYQGTLNGYETNSFDGTTNSYIVADGSGFIDVDGLNLSDHDEFTYSAWFRGYAGKKINFFEQGLRKSDNIDPFKKGANLTNDILYIAGLKNPNDLKYTNSLLDGSWHMISLVSKNDGSSTFKVIIDDDEIDTFDNSLFEYSSNVFASFIRDSYGEWDNIRFFDQALSLSQISDIYVNEINDFPVRPCISEPCDGLINYFNFDNRELIDLSESQMVSSMSPIDFIETTKTGAGYAVSFDNTSSPIELSQSLLDNINTFSISFWIKTDTSTLYKPILAQGIADNDSTNNSGIELISGEIYCGKTDYPFEFESAKTILDNNWHHVFINCEKINEGGASGDMELYIDGKIIGTRLSRSDLDFNDDVLYIGGDGLGSLFQGALDNIRFYNRELKPQDILGIYTRESMQ